MKKMKRETDIFDYWQPRGEKPKLIFEGDLVLLHNWGVNSDSQVTGVAYVVWNSEHHGWDFKMIEGDYIDDSYDKWRQSPRVIGNQTDGVTDEEFKKYENNWSLLIEEHAKKMIEKHFNKRKKELIKDYESRKEKLRNELALLEKNQEEAIDELKKTFKVN